MIYIYIERDMVYCEYIDNYDCYDFDFEEKLSNISLFQNTKILDSTDYFKKEAQKKLKQIHLDKSTTFENRLTEFGIQDQIKIIEIDNNSKL